MASIKQLSDRKYKITISNGYRTDGRKICKAKTIQVPDSVPKRGIEQYVYHEAERLERLFKQGYSEDGEMTFEIYARGWLERQTKYAPGTIAFYRRSLETVFPEIGAIKLNRLRPIALENLLAKLRKRTYRGKPIKEKTVQKYLTVVSAVLSDAKRNEIIEKNPARMIDLPDAECKTQEIPTMEEMQKFLSALCYEEPVWAGPVKNLIDPFGYGGYYINVYDKAGKELIYSRGFNTLFEEWRSTEQAKTETQSWTNSISIPYPKAPVIIEITARDKADMQFHPLLKQEIDPASIFIDRGKLKENRITKIQYNGDSSGKVDLVFLAEGYTADEQEKFVADAKRFTEALFKTPPYDTRREDFNVWAVDAVSEESGTDVSGKGIFKNTALNSGYYTFGVDRYLTTPNMKSIRDAVWNAPCDAIFILVNTDAYGGGGMYNFYAMGTADNPRTPVVFVHEFGHSFAGLADEYFSSEVAYQDFYNLKYEQIGRASCRERV